MFYVCVVQIRAIVIFLSQTFCFNFGTCLVVFWRFIYLTRTHTPKMAIEKGTFKPSRCLCKSPYMANSQGIVLLYRCISHGCNRMLHPACIGKHLCCENSQLQLIYAIHTIDGNYRIGNSSDLKIMQIPVNEVSYSDNVGLDRSCCLPIESAAKTFRTILKSPSSAMGGACPFSIATSTNVSTTESAATSSVYAAPPTPSTAETGTNVKSSMSYVFPASEIVSDSGISAGSRSASISNILDRVGIENPIFPIAQALKITAVATEGKLNTIYDENRQMLANLKNCLEHTKALENEIASLRAKYCHMERAARDAQAAACAAEQGVVGNQIAVVGLPAIDLPTIRNVIAAIVRKLGYEVGPNIVTDANSMMSRGPASPYKGACQQSTSEENNYGNAGGQQLGKIFVSLAYPELRAIMLRRAGDIRRMSLADLGFPNLAEFRIKIFEVLTHIRHNLFSKIRAKAERMGLFKVWHRNGTIFARSKGTSAVVRIFHISDLDKLV